MHPQPGLRGTNVNLADVMKTTKNQLDFLQGSVIEYYTPEKLTKFPELIV